MKKRLSLLIIFSIVILTFTGCFGTYHYNSIEKYQQIRKDPFYNADFIPYDTDEYTINNFSFINYVYLDTCYEVFLDITVNEQQFDELVLQAKSHGEFVEQDAWYADGYTEIVFEDDYHLGHGYFEDCADVTPTVGWATIEKVIYNRETLNIIYICFHSWDTCVYEVSDVQYFNHFKIDPQEYINHLPQQPATELKN